MSVAQGCFKEAPVKFASSPSDEHGHTCTVVRHTRASVYMHHFMQAANTCTVRAHAFVVLNAQILYVHIG